MAPSGEGAGRRARAVACVGLLVAVCCPRPGRADEERLDHRGQRSVLVSGGPELLRQARIGQRDPAELGALGDLSLGVPVTDDGGTLLVGLRAGGDGAWGARLVPQVTWRRYTGPDEWKPFLDFGGFVRALPALAIGGRFGLGLQRELSEHLGVFAATGVGVAAARGLQASVDLTVGVQLRFARAGEP